MADSTTPTLQRERSLILGGLLMLSALAWALLIWQASTMSHQAMGPDDGYECALVHGYMDRHDGRDDVSHRSPDDPHVQQHLPKPTKARALLCPDLGLRECLSAHLVVVRGSGILSRRLDRAAGSAIHVAHGKRCAP